VPKKQWTARLYLGRDAEGKQIFQWVGRFDTKRERDKALAEAKLKHERGGSLELPTCDAYVDRYLADYERRNKDSSYVTERERLKRFAKDFAGRSLDISRAEAKDWVNGEGRWDAPVPARCVKSVVTLYNYAIDEDDLNLERNPFRKLGRSTKGRAEQAPPTEEEFQRLLDASSVLGDYGPTMRALTLFAAFTLMRPGEIFPLEWSDIDFERMRIRKARRLFRGGLDVPKTGAVTIALTPPARDAILGLERSDHLVFHSRTGKRLDQPKLSLMWKEVCAKAGISKPFYLCTKHYGVHYMWRTLRMSAPAIAAQAGWSVKTVDSMLAVYGHADIGALDEVDRAFEAAPKPTLRVVEGGRE
jgi:integrase